MRLWSMAVSAAMIGGLLAAPAAAQPDDDLFCKYEAIDGSEHSISNGNIWNPFVIGIEDKCPGCFGICVGNVRCVFSDPGDSAEAFRMLEDKSVGTVRLVTYCDAYKLNGRSYCPDATSCTRQEQLRATSPRILTMPQE